MAERGEVSHRTGRFFGRSNAADPLVRDQDLRV